MRHYHATLVPQTSLFLGRDRGNRVVRHSFHYIPASTISGALNTRFYQMGRQDLVGRFRFGNLHPATEGEGESVWMPAPRNLYYCPACGGGHLITDFRPEQALSERICSRDGCRAMLRAEQGVVETRRNGELFEVLVDHRRPSPPTVNAQIVGRTALHRSTGAHVDGQLHQVEVLRVRGVPFHGDVWVEDGAEDVLCPGVTFRLSIGGLRSRGSGRAELEIGAEIASTPAEDVLLLAETPLLPLPEDEVEDVAMVRATIVAPYAQMAVNERWAAKPLRSGKGLVSFLNAVTVGSALTLVEEGSVAQGDVMYFYRLHGPDLILYGFDRTACLARTYCVDYDFSELWTLGYGRVRWLTEGADNEA